MTIRAATPADAEGIADLQVRSWRVAYRGQVPDEHLDTLVAESLLPNLRWSLEHPPADWRLWIADEDGAIVGFASTGPSLDTDATPATGELSAIYVDPDRPRRGIGTALLEHALGDLGERSKRVTLWVLESNAAGRAFFEARGFAADGQRTWDLIGEVLVPAVRYRRALERVVGSAGSRPTS